MRAFSLFCPTSFWGRFCNPDCRCLSVQFVMCFWNTFEAWAFGFRGNCRKDGFSPEETVDLAEMQGRDSCLITPFVESPTASVKYQISVVSGILSSGRGDFLPGLKFHIIPATRTIRAAIWGSSRHEPLQPLTRPSVKTLIGRHIFTSFVSWLYHLFQQFFCFPEYFLAFLFFLQLICQLNCLFEIISRLICSAHLFVSNADILLGKDICLRAHR